MTSLIRLRTAGSELGVMSFSPKSLPAEEDCSAWMLGGGPPSSNETVERQLTYRRDEKVIIQGIVPILLTGSAMMPT